MADIMRILPRDLADIGPDNQGCRRAIDGADEFIDLDLKPWHNRIWVVGNGPSLRAEDLTKLHEAGETCVGINRIHLLYDQTPWRPNAWCFGDFHRNEYWPEDLFYHVKQGYPCYIKNIALLKLGLRLEQGNRSWIDYDWSKNIIPISECFHDFLEVRPPSAWHLPYICAFSGSMNMAIQVAFTMLKPEAKLLILMGVDHSWEPRYTQKTDDPNHFSGDYDKNPEYEDDPLTPRRIERIEAESVMAHRIAAKEVRMGSGLIVNATRKTNLQVHPKADLDKILEQL
jgi:hypothetical protein